jgi:hypothetical protein
MLPFTWKARSGNTSTLPQLQKSASSLEGKLFDSITSLTLERFIRVACENDYSALFIDPKEFVLTAELGKVWTDIHEAFLDGMKDKEGIHKLRLVGKINHLQFVYEHIHLCVKYLSIAYDPEVVAYLQAHVMVGVLNPEDAVGYINSLQIILNRAQMILFQIQEKQAELKVIQGSEKPGEKTTRKHFDQLIAGVSIYAKFHINKKEISVSEFIEYYTARREHFEAMEKEYSKSTR